jgi:L-2-hydroxyglutarate oxidase LhgO
MDIVDITIIGAGVVGLAIAARLGDKNKEIFVLEKNPSFGQETSSRHSGVIHSGIYYPQDSLKSRLCVEGNKLLQELEAFFQRGLQAGNKELKLISGEELKQIEPRVRAVAAIHSPLTGIIDSHGLMQCYILQAIEKGVQFAYQAEVIGIEKCAEGFQVTVKDISGEFSFVTRRLINSAGLYADKMAELAGIDLDKDPLL